MELLEKYLQAVKFWLPSSQQHDIIAELRDDIRSEVDERENELGRRLNENEWETLLKQRGRPLLVAEKYLPQRWLIGPILFPAYWFVLKLVLLCYFAPCIAVWIGLVTFNSHYRASHLGWAAIGDAFFLLSNSIIGCTVVTLIFAIIERVKDQEWLANQWSPRKLPPVRDTQRIPRSGSGIELIVNLIFGIWWLKILWTLTAFESGGVKISLPPAWHYFFWAFLPVVVFSVLLAAVNLLMPYWTRRRRALKAALNFMTAMAMFFVAQEFAPVIGQGPVFAADKVARFSWIVTCTLGVTFGIGTLICLTLAGVDAWRASKIGPAPSQLNNRVAI